MKERREKMEGETDLNVGESGLPSEPVLLDIRHILKEMGIQAECLKDTL